MATKGHLVLDGEGASKLVERNRAITLAKSDAWDADRIRQCSRWWLNVRRHGAREHTNRHGGLNVRALVFFPKQLIADVVRKLSER